MQRQAVLSQGGFTLIELLIVMAIIGMLAAIVGPTIMDQLSGAKPKAAAAQIAQFETALDTYKLDVGRYPPKLEGLIKNIGGSKVWTGPYIKKQELPLDPWGNEYQYKVPGNHNKKSFDLYSFGADGQDGGEGNNADVTNW